MRKARFLELHLIIERSFTEWKAARKSKKVKVAAPIPAPMIIETGSERPLRDGRDTTLEGLLAAKTEECLLLMNRLCKILACFLYYCSVCVKLVCFSASLAFL